MIKTRETYSDFYVLLVDLKKSRLPIGGIQISLVWVMPHYYLSADQVMTTKRKRLEGVVTSELEDAVLEQSTGLFSPIFGENEDDEGRNKKRRSLSGIRDASQDATFVAVNV